MGGKIRNTLENEKNTCSTITGLLSKFGFHVFNIQRLQIFAEGSSNDTPPKSELVGVRFHLKLKRAIAKKLCSCLHGKTVEIYVELC